MVIAQWIHLVGGYDYSRERRYRPPNPMYMLQLSTEILLRRWFLMYGRPCVKTIYLVGLHYFALLRTFSEPLITTNGMSFNMLKETLMTGIGSSTSPSMYM